MRAKSLLAVFVLCCAGLACSSAPQVNDNGPVVQPRTRTISRSPVHTAPTNPRLTTYPLPEGEEELAAGEIEIYAINTRERKRIRIVRPDGELDEDALEELEHLLRDHRRDRARHPHRRLALLLYLTAQHFGRPLHLVSGYRHPGRGQKRTSRHCRAMAADIRVPGVPPKVVWKWMQANYANVGLGYYPVSDFVHLDVRDRSYYWVDRSGPGQKSKERSVKVRTKPKKGADWTVKSLRLPVHLRPNAPSAHVARAARK